MGRKLPRFGKMDIIHLPYPWRAAPRSLLNMPGDKTLLP